jgi:hypothetical protein
MATRGLRNWPYTETGSPCVTAVVARLGPRNEGARVIEIGTIRTSIQGAHRRAAAAAGERGD